FNILKNGCNYSRSGPEPLDWQSKGAANTALRPNDLRRARIELQLPPQPQDLHIDATVENVFVHPSRLQQMLTAQKAAAGRREKRSAEHIRPWLVRLGFRSDRRDAGYGGRAASRRTGTGHALDPAESPRDRPPAAP